MIESVPLTTAQKTVMGQQSNSLKNRMKRGNSDVTLFQYKVTVLFLFWLEHLWDSWLTKLLGQFIELHNPQFFKRLKIWPKTVYIVLFSFMQHLEKLKVNFTPESIYKKKNVGSRNTQTSIFICIYTRTYHTYTYILCIACPVSERRSCMVKNQTYS